jgi:hypothetical protein
MRISVSDARAFAKLLTEGADAAEKAGATDFDLTSAAQALDDAARGELAAAIASAQQGG